MKKKYVYIAAGVIFVYIVIRVLMHSGAQQNPNAQGVSVAPVVQQNVVINMQTIGTVQAYSTVDVKSMVTGPLLRAGFKEGDFVEKDQVLFEIDPRSFEAALNQAKANLARDQATLTNNELQVERNTPLLKKGYIAKQDYDTLVANKKSIEATVKADEASVENAALQLSYATIRAPIPGKTGNILLKVGSVIKANDTGALVTINQISPIYVAFSIPQNKLPGIQESLRHGAVKVKAIIRSDQTEEGDVTFVDNSVDVATGTIQLKATFPNELRRLWPGQYVTVDLPVERLQNALLIPSLAILTGQQGFYVYVIDENNIAHLRVVKPGSAVGSQTVIEAGLKVGEKVVTSGQLRLKEGTPVRVD